MNKSDREKTIWTAGIVAASIVAGSLGIFRDSRNLTLLLASLAALLLAWGAFLLLVKAPLKESSRANIFLSVMVLAMGIGTASGEWMQMLLFLAYPLTFVLSPTLVGGLIWSWALTGSVAIGLLSHGSDPLEVLGYSLVIGLFSSGMGLWIDRIWRWGMERESMRAALETSQEQLVQATRERATQDERERLAREVHDTLAQGYVAIIALSQSPGTRSQIEAIARENLDEARALVNAWKPPALSEHGLQGALSRLGESNGANFTSNAGEVPLETETVLFRSAQEALNNVRRHAGASRVSISLQESPSDFTLTVTDNGRGIQNAAPGNGLLGMTERAKMLGGTVLVTSDNGTTVKVSIPKELA